MDIITLILFLWSLFLVYFFSSDGIDGWCTLSNQESWLRFHYHCIPQVGLVNLGVLVRPVGSLRYGFAYLEFLTTSVFLCLWAPLESGLILPFDVFKPSLKKNELGMLSIKIMESLVAWEGKFQVTDKVIGHLAFP